MKILYINWSPLQKGAEVGGGVNIYTQSIAVAMMAKGHTVYSLISGSSYNYAGGVYIKRSKNHKEIINYEVVNAPNMAPGFFNYSAPLDDLSEPHIDKIFSRFLESIQPDVVHFNNIEGFSANCIKIAKSSGARVIYSLHNYHPLCNQIGLLYQNKEICYDFNEGNRCLDCVTPPPKSLEARQRRIRYHSDEFVEGHLLWDALKFVHTQLKTIKIGVRVIGSIVKSKKERIALGQQSIESMTYDNSQADIDNSRLAGLPYKERRAGMIDAINHADCVLAVSDWVNQLYLKMGVNQTCLHTSHIGSAIADLALSNPYLPIKKDLKKPVKMVYIGISDTYKGLPFFLNALSNMDGNILSKIDLHVYARDYHQLDGAFKQLAGRMGGLVTRDGYKYAEIPRILQNMDIGVVPPIWWDNAPQVVFEMLAMKVPVLGANICGIPDFVRHMDNGLLFEPGNASDLIEKITTIVRKPQLIDRFKSAITPMKTTAQHVDELEKYYQ